MKKLKQWAKENGLHSSTAYRWAKAGTMPVETIQTETGAWFVIEDAAPQSTPKKTVVYARVSGHDQKDSLDRQVASIVRKYDGTTDRIVTEVGSGMNPGRTKINALLADPEVGTIVVENRDRLARMNVELIESALAASGRKIVYVEDSEEEDWAERAVEAAAEENSD